MGERLIPLLKPSLLLAPFPLLLQDFFFLTESVFEPVNIMPVLCKTLGKMQSAQKEPRNPTTHTRFVIQHFVLFCVCVWVCVHAPVTCFLEDDQNVSFK